MSWAEKQFSDLYAVDSRNGIYKSAEFHGSGCRIVNMTEMFAYEFISNQEMQRLQLDEQEMKRDTLLEGDLLYGRRSLVPKGAGKCALVTKLKSPLTFESSIIRARLNTEIANPKFYYYWFNSPIGRRQVNRVISGTNIKGITGTDLRKIIVPNPPKVQQQKIVEILSDCDTAIEQVIKQRRLLSEIHNQMMRSLFAESTQEVWRTDKIGKFFELGRGRVISKDYIEQNSGVYPVYSSQTANSGLLGKIDTFDFDGEYLTWTTDGANAGTVFFRNGKFNCTNVCGTAKAKAESEVSTAFAALALKPVAKKYVSKVGNPKLMNNVFSEIPISYPSRHYQSTIIETDRQFQIITGQLDEQVVLLKQQKRGLMQQLLTGKLRVKGAA